MMSLNIETKTEDNGKRRKGKQYSFRNIFIRSFRAVNDSPSMKKINKESIIILRKQMI